MERGKRRLTLEVTGNLPLKVYTHIVAFVPRIFLQEDVGGGGGGTRDLLLIIVILYVSHIMIVVHCYALCDLSSTF